MQKIICLTRCQLSSSSYNFLNPKKLNRNLKLCSKLTPTLWITIISHCNCKIAHFHSTALQRSLQCFPVEMSSALLGDLKIFRAKINKTYFLFVIKSFLFTDPRMLKNIRNIQRRINAIKDKRAKRWRNQHRIASPAKHETLKHYHMKHWNIGAVVLLNFVKLHSTFVCRPVRLLFARFKAKREKRQFSVGVGSINLVRLIIINAISILEAELSVGCEINNNLHTNFKAKKSFEWKN